MLLRHPKLRARLARTHRRIRESLKLEMISKLIPELMKTGRESREVRRVALEAVLNGLVLEYAYDPETISQAQATAVLGRMFDVLMAAKQPSEWVVIVTVQRLVVRATSYHAVPSEMNCSVADLPGDPVSGPALLKLLPKLTVFALI